MDTSLLIAKLLLRGFKHHKDDEVGRKMYINGEKIVSVRGRHVCVAVRFESADEALALVDYIGDQYD